MSKIPFKVSARTARLIGRENIASSKGAIIELVKNAYDADSKICIVYFDNQYSIIKDQLSIKEYTHFLNKNIPQTLLAKAYQKSKNGYKIINSAKDYDKSKLKKELCKLNTLYIIDAGEGMTKKIIKENWMIIGTNNKEQNIFTRNNRIKAGSKGIGRFALDKLGAQTEMITIFHKAALGPDVNEDQVETNYCGYNWKVKWSDFEGEFKTIDNVKADLNGIKSKTLKDEILNLIDNEHIIDLLDKYKFQHGTILKLSGLREAWEDFYVEQIFSDLEVLIPPKEGSTFDIFLFSSSEKIKYGEIIGSVCDDYDYKLVATADENQTVKITVYRNEYDIETIDPEFFKREAMKKSPFRKKDFKKGSWTIEKTFSQLLAGFKDVDEDSVFDDIGIFDFALYFMKKTYTTPDAEKYFYRKFRSNERKDWMDKFGGIKLFRDNFRVRPYGEVNNSAFDWLGLGARKAQSPAGIAKKEGGYKVNPDNVAGAIKISRLTNVNFEDKSSREGLQENKTFIIFKKIITEIMNVLENDRAYIAREMNLYYNDKYSDRINKEKAEAIAKSILETNRKKKEGENNQSGEQVSDKEVVLAELNKDKSEEIEKLKDEQKVLRGLASSGIVLASFSHDLSKLNNVLNSRIDKFKKLISTKINEKQYSNVEDRKNPFVQLERMKKQDLKLQNWLNFSLGAARKDKRKRKQLYFQKYFQNFKIDWGTVLDSRGITLYAKDIEHIDMRVFEIDIDSIFNNLLVNSIDSFIISKINRYRKITIKVYSNKKEIVIDYYDNGPGLSKDIDNPEKIFQPLYTTKRNKYTGDEEGTGLGMWLVQSIVKDYDGNTKLLFPKQGFGLRIIFPIKYKRG